MDPSFRLQTGAIPVCVATVWRIALMSLAASKVNRVSNLFELCFSEVVGVYFNQY